MTEKAVGMKLMDLWNADSKKPDSAGFAGMGTQTLAGYIFVVTYN